MEDDLDTRIDSRLKEHKNEMLSEIKTLLQISTNTSTSEISKLSNKLLNADIPKFRRKSNEEQYKLNVKVIGKLDEVEQANSLEQAKFLTKEAADQLLHRQKLILLADSSELGWRVVQEYETNPLADDSDDEKRIFKAEARATRKFKAERGRRGRGRFTPYSRTGKAANGAGQTQEKAFGQTSGNMKPGLCFGCGKPGHWKKECLGTSNNKISSLLYSNKSESLNTVDETCGVEFDRGEPVKVASPVGPNLANVLYDRLHTAGCPESMDTANRMAGYLLKSRADSTTDKYSSYFKAFERFCLSRYLVCNPANSMSVALSITYLIDSDKSYSVISASVYAIKWKHSLYGRADPTDDSVVRNLLEAAKRLKSRPTVKKDVINAQTLIDLCLLFKDNKELVNIRDLAMILVCFAGFLRFNEMKNLLCSDVNFYNDHFTLKIRSSKTDMYREGSEIMIAKGTSVACPYLMLERYMNIASLKVGSDEFLFRPIYKSSGRYSLVKKNKGISYTRAKECISSKLSMVAPGLKLGTHSLRASGATVAANTKDISDRCIKRHGRWRSEKAKDGYIKDNIEKKLYITKCLGL